MNGRQFIYHMQGLTKTYPGNRKVLENINLSFYPDAKIGVLGVNGSGKSTLLRIMAGIDKEFIGEGWVAEGARVGYLEQEPQLDAKLVRARERHAGRRRQEGAARPLQRDRRQLLGRDRRRDGEAAGRDRRQEPVGARLPGRSRDGRAALPAGRRRRHQALRRRAPPRRAVPAAARPAGPAPARRADQPSRRRVRALAGRPSAQLSGRDPDRHPRPLLPRQRHRLDSRARPRPGHSLPGQLHRLARRRSRSGWSRRAARRPRTSARSRASRSGSRPRRAPGRRNPRRATSATRNCSPRRPRSRPRPRRSSSRWPSGSARTSSTSIGCGKASATTC